MPCLLWSIQQPIIECLVAKGDATKLFTPVDVPGADTHPDLFGSRVFMEVLTHSQQYSGGGCGGEEIRIKVSDGYLHACMCLQEGQHSQKQKRVGME